MKSILDNYIFRIHEMRAFPNR